jgi:hypothetical protein
MFIATYRRKAFCGELRQYLGDVFRKLRCRRKAGSNKVISCRITSATPTAASSGSPALPGDTYFDGHSELIFKFELTALNHGKARMRRPPDSSCGRGRPKAGDWSGSIRRGRQAG